MSQPFEASQPAAAPATSATLAPAEPATFLHRLFIVTLSVLLVVLLMHLARELRDILQPLLIATFIGYLILPAHAWLMGHGFSRWLAIVAFLAGTLLALFILSALVRSNIEEALARLPRYEQRLQQLVDRGLSYLPMEKEEAEQWLLDVQRAATTRLTESLRTAVGQFLDFLISMFIVLIYLIFLLAERVGFPRRMRRALGDAPGDRVLGIIATINQAIAQYIAVKTFVSFLAGAASYVVLAAVGVDFAIMWAILIFLFNFIPYLGSLLATALPIVLSFVQFDEAWRGIAVAVLLVAIQQAIGMFIEPKLAGHRLGVSPLLIILSLAFWGLVWGIVGMILAVPLLVTVKIILDNIPETKAVARLMSNV
ncbi:MAG: AI-2E family transporter [Gemmataceae bacterium]|nr:AI-2E family transporter [Gemmataceae bacterium]